MSEAGHQRVVVVLGARVLRGGIASPALRARVRLGVELFWKREAKAVTLKKGKTSLFDADGSAVVVHAKADDHASQPAGAAGDRIACGVVELASATGGMTGSMGGGAAGGVTGGQDEGVSGSGAGGRDAGTK